MPLKQLTFITTITLEIGLAIRVITVVYENSTQTMVNPWCNHSNHNCLDCLVSTSVICS